MAKWEVRRPLPTSDGRFVYTQYQDLLASFDLDGRRRWLYHYPGTGQRVGIARVHQLASRHRREGDRPFRTTPRCPTPWR